MGQNIIVRLRLSESGKNYCNMTEKIVKRKKNDKKKRRKPSYFHKETWPTCRSISEVYKNLSLESQRCSQFLTQISLFKWFQALNNTDSLIRQWKNKKRGGGERQMCNIRRKNTFLTLRYTLLSISCNFFLRKLAPAKFFFRGMRGE